MAPTANTAKVSFTANIAPIEVGTYIGPLSASGRLSRACTGQSSVSADGNGPLSALWLGYRLPPSPTTPRSVPVRRLPGGLEQITELLNPS